MKKRSIQFPGKLILPALVAIVFTACASNDTNPATTVNSTDTAMTEPHDTSMADHTHVQQMDTGHVSHAPDSMPHTGKDTSAAPKTGKDTSAKPKTGQ